MPARTAFRSRSSGWRNCLRPYASSCRVSVAARPAAELISTAFLASGLPAGRSSISNSLWQMIAVRMLLNSCATPPASLPTVSIF